MLPRLLALVAMLGLAWVVRRLSEGFVSGAVRRAQSAGGGGTATEELVRDRECNTFLPRARALSVDREGRTFFFCSEACRQRFLSRTPS